MTDEDRAGYLWRGLNTCMALDKDLTIATVTHWLEYHGAGSPDVPLMQERVRDDARYWAMAATQPELEAYVSAAVIELENSPVTARATKRLAAWAWKNMRADDRA